MRFTPTCVGTATPTLDSPGAGPVHPHVRGDGARPAAATSPATVHPHVRGNGTLVASERIAASGSPPRAWGRRFMIYEAYYVIVLMG